MSIEKQRRAIDRIDAQIVKLLNERTEHVLQTADRMLLCKVSSWFMGVNSNLEGRDQRHFMLYAGGLPYYRERCAEIAENDYEGFTIV